MRKPKAKRHAALGLMLLFLGWALLPRAETKVIPPLYDVLVVGVNMLSDGSLLRDISISLCRVGIGIIFGIFCSFLVGIFSAFPLLRHFISGPLELARPIPPIAWIPLMLLFFGTGNKAAIALVTLAAFFPLATAVVIAFDSMDPDLVLVAKSHGASVRDLVTYIYCPAMAPIVFSGLRTAVGIGWFSVVAAEMLGSYGGLGYGIQLTSLNLEMERFFVYLLTIGTCGFCMNGILAFVDRHVNNWQIGSTNVD